MSYNLEKLSPEERAKLLELLAKSEEPEQSNPVVANLADPVLKEQERQWGEPPKANPGDITVTPVPEPADWVKRQIDTLKSVGRTNYLAGIKSPKRDPIKAAIDAQGRYEEQMKKDEVLKRRKASLEKVTSAEWLAMAETLGPDKLVDGVVKRQYKVERFVSKFQPLLKAHVAAIQSKPDVTDSDREARMLDNLRGLKALKGKWK
jgi:hypothetical protein